MSKRSQCGSAASHQSSSDGRVMRKKNINLGLDGIVHCHHKLPAICKVAGPRSSRCGDEFYGCPHWQISNCNFFAWKVDVDELLKARGEEIAICEANEQIKKLQEENYILENKIAKLKVKKKKFEEEIRELKM